jgi:hypothetical protein
MKLYTLKVHAQTIISRFLVLSFVILTACKRESTCEVNSFQPTDSLVLNNLLGTWKLDDHVHVEIWDKIGKDKYRSRVFAVKNLDSTLEETAKVYLNNHAWIFETQVIDQNDGEKVQFKSNKITSNEIHFSNPGHDFPTDICYHLRSKSVLSAWIVGKNKRKENDTIFFNYQRITQN